MFRDFSASAKEKLIGYVEEATNASGWDKIADGLSDVGLHVENWFGWLNIKRYVNNLDEYHRKIIDKNDMSIQQIEDIFTNVKNIDTKYSEGFKGELQTLNGVVNFVSHLAESIDPKGGNLDMSNRGTVLQADIDAIIASRTTAQNAVSDKMLGTEPAGAATSVDPVNLCTGNFIYEHKDISIDGEIPMVFHRYYNSQDARITSLGRCFRHNYDIILSQKDNSVDITMEDGQHIYFEKENDLYLNINGISETLIENENVYLYTKSNGNRFTFDKSGKLLRYEKETLKGINFEYSEEGLLLKALSDHGDYFEFSYNAQQYIERITDNDGREVVLSYNGNYLNSVSMPEGVCLKYRYAKNGRISEVINSLDAVSVKNTYDTKFRVTKQVFADGSNMSFRYNDAENSVIQIERNGAETIYIHDDRYRNIETIYQDGTKEQFIYNERNQCISKTDRNNHTTRMAYDNRGNMTQAVDACKRKANFTYDANNRLLSVSVNGKQILRNVYDKYGNLTYTEDALGMSHERVYSEDGRCLKENINGRLGRSYSYDEKGNIISVLNGLGAKAGYEYDKLNRVVAVVDANQNKEYFSYDKQSRITKITNAAGDSQYIKYNTNGKPVEVTDFDGYKTLMEYDDLGRLIAETDKEGNRITYDYDAMWNISRICREDGGIEQREYDLNNKQIKTILPNGGVFTYSYDPAGNRVETIDPEGNITKYRYREDDSLRSVEEANGAITHYEYDADGNMTGIVDALGNRVSFTYDAAGNRTSYTDEKGYTTFFQYAKNGALERILYPNGGTSEYTYDKEGRLTEYLGNDGTKEVYLYDLNGNLLEKINGLGRKKSFEYDCLNRVIKSTNEVGGIRFYTYDKVGNLTSETDENGNTTQYAYSPNGNMIKVTDALGNETEYTYNKSGYVSNILRHGEGITESTKFEWDFLGNIKRITNPLGDVEEYIYDKCGQLLSKMDQDGYTTKYHYNNVNQIDAITYADSRKVTFSYNLAKQLEKITDWLGTTSITLDEFGMPISVVDPFGAKVEYEWGCLGEKKKIIYPNGDQVRYSYNAQNQLVRLSNSDGDTVYEYDEIGRFISRSMPGGLRINYQYNDLGRISTIHNYKGESLLETFGYKYDAAGNKIEEFRERSNCPEDNGIISFDVDALNRISRVSKNGSAQRSYRYDAFGNRVEMKDCVKSLITNYVYNINNQLTDETSNASHTEYTYDRRGNLVKAVSDNSDKKLAKEYVFDAANKMSEVVVYSQNEEVSRASYEYNGLGKKLRTSRNSHGVSERYQHVLDLTRRSHNLLARKNIDTKADEMFVYDGKVMARKSNQLLSYYLSDDHGSPTSFVTDDNIINYVYQEFGCSEQNDYSIQPFGYTGYQYDETAQMYDAHARAYLPTLGRFTSEDRVRGFIYQPITMNRYVYAVNKPEDFEDDDGEWLHIVVGAAVGGLVSAAISVTTQTISGLKEGKSLGESLKDVDLKKVAIETVKGAAKGAITAAVPGMGVIANAAVGAGIDTVGEVATQMICEGRAITEVDGSKVVGTAVASFTIGAAVGGLQKTKVFEKATEKIRFLPKNQKNYAGKVQKWTEVMHGRECAIKTFKEQLTRVTAESRKNKIQSRISDAWSAFGSAALSHLKYQAAKGVNTVIENELYKSRFKNLIKDNVDYVWHCYLAA